MFSSSAMSCLCCLFASMVKEMSGALLCWAGCCKTCGLHYLISGMGTHVCLRRQGSWDMQTRKKKLFLSKQSKVNRYNLIAISLRRTSSSVDLEHSYGMENRMESFGSKCTKNRKNCFLAFWFEVFGVLFHSCHAVPHCNYFLSIGGFKKYFPVEITLSLELLLNHCSVQVEIS